MRFASVVFDFDSTLVDAESFDMVCERSLADRPDRDAVVAEIGKITTLGVEGVIPFEESLRRRLALAAPHRSFVGEVAQELAERLTCSLVPHLDFFTAHADATYIVSHGFNELIEPAADRLRIPRENIFANAFRYDADGYVAGIDDSRPLARAGGKARALFAAKLPGPVVMIGDGYTDCEVKLHGAADAFIAFVEHARREKAIAAADCVASSFDDVRAFLEKTPDEA